MNLEKAYKTIQEHYGTNTTDRYNIPLMHHIDQGLLIMDFFVNTDSKLYSDQIICNQESKILFVLHPIFQNDEDYHKNYKIMDQLSGDLEILINHYRITANGHLLGNSDNIILSRYPEVNMALFADKISNRYNFEKYYEKTHEKSSELRKYFKDWFYVLGISEPVYNRFCLFFKEWDM